MSIMRSLEKFVLVKRRLSTWQPCRLNYHAHISKKKKKKIRSHLVHHRERSLLPPRLPPKKRRPFTYTADARPRRFFFLFFILSWLAFFFLFLFFSSFLPTGKHLKSRRRRHTKKPEDSSRYSIGTMKLLIYLNTASCPFKVKIYARRRVNCKPII